VGTPSIAAALILTGLICVPAGTTATDAGLAECVRLSGVQRIVFSAQKFPNVRRHFRGGVRRGWPRRLVVNRRGADARRERVLRDIPTREDFDRDEYPPSGWSSSLLSGAVGVVDAGRAEGRRPCPASGARWCSGQDAVRDRVRDLRVVRAVAPLVAARGGQDCAARKWPDLGAVHEFERLLPDQRHALLLGPCEHALVVCFEGERNSAGPGSSIVTWICFN
jgi:hypothetical protein